MGLDALFNGFMMVGIVYSTPLFIAIGSLLSVPLSVVSDYALHGARPSALTWLGLAAVIAGFALLTASEALRAQRRQRSNRTQGWWLHLVPTLY